MMATREEAYDSLAGKILSINSVFTPVVMKKQLNMLRIEIK